MIKHLENVHKIASGCRKRPHPQPQKAKELRPATEFSKKCDRLLAEWICSDFQAFEVVENEFFKRFVNALNGEYKLPSRKTVSERLVPELAAVVETETKAVLNKATHVVISTDGWTSKATENFLALTCHFIQEDKFASITLGVEKLIDQTAVGHANSINKILSKHEGLSRKVHTLISDNAEVMKCTARNMNLFWFGCYPHTLNLVVKDALKLPQCSALLTDVRNISSHFKRSCKASDRLCDIQKNMKMPQHRMKRDVETRWSSTYEMLERFTEQFAAVQMVCHEDEHLCCPSRSDVRELRKVQDLLKPFKEVTTLMSSEKNVTASSVIIIVYIIDILQLIF